MKVRNEEIVNKIKEKNENLRDKYIEEKKLKELNNYLDLALEGSNLGVWEWKIPENTVRYDKRWAEMIGFKVEEIQHTFEF